MSELNQAIKLSQPAEYRIEIQGRLDAKWASSFNGMQVSSHTIQPGFTITVLQGKVADQSALHGMLNQIRDLGLPLLLVKCLSAIKDQ